MQVAIHDVLRSIATLVEGLHTTKSAENPEPANPWVEDWF